MQLLWIFAFFLHLVISDGAYVWNKLKTTTSYDGFVTTATSGAGQYVYVAASSYLWRSDNYGAASSWQTCSLISSTAISSIDEVVVSDSGDLVFVLSHDPTNGGIYRSRSYGLNNTYSKLGLAYESVSYLSLSADGQVLTATYSSLQSPKALLSFSAGGQSAWTVVSEPQDNRLGGSYGRNTVVSGDGKVLYTSIQSDGNRVCHLDNVSETYSCEYFTWNLMAAMATTFDGSVLYFLDTRGDFNVYQYATSFSSRVSIGIDGYGGVHLCCSKWGQRIIATNTNASSKSFALYNSDYGLAQWEVIGPFAYVNGGSSGFAVPERISNVAMSRNGSHWFVTTSTLWNEWYQPTRKPVSIFSFQSSPETADATHVFTTSQPSRYPTQIGGSSQSSSSSSSVSDATIGIIVGVIAVAIVVVAVLAYFCLSAQRSATSSVPDRVPIPNNASLDKDPIAERIVAEPMIIAVEAVAYQPGTTVLGGNSTASFVALSTEVVHSDPIPSAPMMISSSYVPYNYRPAPSSYVPYSLGSAQQS